MRFSRNRLSSSSRHFLPGIFLLLAGLLFCVPYGVFAQETGSVTLTAPDTSQFPSLSFFMEAYDASGFINDLRSADVRIIENGRELPAASVTAVQPGLQLIVAYNLSPAMAAKQGSQTLYEKLQAGLQAWAKSQPADTPDDFTLVGNEGLLAIRQEDPARWVEELGAYQPDLARIKPGMSSLTQALDIATDPNPRPNMKRALLYITPPPADNNLSALANLTQRASKMGLRVFIWAVVPSVTATGKGLDALQTLAGSSGGQLFLYTGAETLPSIENYFKPLRSIYQVTYQSAIQQPGIQLLRVKIKRGSQTLTADTQEFKLDVQPPNPMFLEPPAAIQRKLDNAASGSLASGQPESVNLRILVEFPDGHPRQIIRSRLYVDGKLAVENTRAPFDQFNWSLAGYDSSQRHSIQARVEDSLGLSSASLEWPVEVLVETSGAPHLALPANSQRLVVGGAVGLSALALVLVLWVSGRKGWLPGEHRRRKHLLADPVTQPVQIQQDRPRPNVPTGIDRASWPLPAAPVRKAPAWLLQLDPNYQPVAGHTILFIRREMTFGSNPQQASCVLNFPGVDELHARLYVDPQGSYILSDAGSVAGTWVNYCPVPQTGVRLEHGDLVHFGPAAFRFELAAPAHLRQPVVERCEEL